MSNTGIIKTKARKPRKAAVAQDGNLFQLIPYAHFIAKRISKLYQNHRYA